MFVIHIIGKLMFRVKDSAERGLVFSKYLFFYFYYFIIIFLFWGDPPKVKLVHNYDNYCLCCCCCCCCCCSCIASNSASIYSSYNIILQSFCKVRCNKIPVVTDFFFRNLFGITNKIKTNKQTNICFEKTIPFS